MLGVPFGEFRILKTEAGASPVIKNGYPLTVR